MAVDEMVKKELIGSGEAIAVATPRQSDGRVARRHGETQGGTRCAECAALARPIQP